jgi:amidase
VDDYIDYCRPFGAGGQPAVSLPLARSRADLPIGAQLVAATGRDDRLLRVAAELERAAPWHRAAQTRLELA